MVDKKVVVALGKRKKSIARARVKPGKGIVKVNGQPLELMTNEIVRLKIQEPLIILGDLWKSYDIQVNVHGGGILGQADAARQAISKGLVSFLGDESKKTLTEYDRNLLVYDTRRTEPHKPSRSSQGPRRHKQRSKR